MKLMANAFQGQRCPACEHEFVASSATEATKVRCPRCREVVVLTAVRAADGCPTSNQQDPPAPSKEQVRSAEEIATRHSSPVPPPNCEDRPLRADEILLYVTEHDPESRLQADLLVKILPRAGWEVRDIIAGPLPAPCGPGLTFAAASAVSATRLSKTFNTLREAGFSVTLHLDPGLHANETMVMLVPNATAVATQ